MISQNKARLQAKNLVDQMTLPEKIAQLNFRAPAINRLGIADYTYWNEALHGIARAGVATVFPQAIAMAAMFDEKLMEDIGTTISLEGRAKYNQYHALGDHDIYKGLTYWSPNINIFRDPRWGRGQETYGEDPFLTSRLGVAFIKGLQGHEKYLRLAACAKHFVAHSGPEGIRHGFNAEVSEKDLAEFFLPAFAASVQEGNVESVMTAYNAINGVPASVNERILRKILMGQWHFKGHVVSDFRALEDVHEHHHYTKDAAETMASAVRAGLDLCAGDVNEGLFAALDRQLITEEEITEAVVHLFTTRVKLGMFANDCAFDKIPYEVNDCAEHRAQALTAAEKSMVLLVNKENFLPLAQKPTTVAVIGPNADSREVLQGNYFGTASEHVTFLGGVQEAVNKFGGRVYYGLGCHLFKDHAESGLSRADERESEALIAVAHADVAIVCLGLDPTIEGEAGDAGNIYGSGDKVNLKLPGHQQQLLQKIIALGKPVIVVLASGSALTLDGLEQAPNVKAVIEAWYPGSLGGRALANLLFGAVSPSGKLPVTFYHDSDELPDFTDYSMRERTYQNTNATVDYPFGYGLTYCQMAVDEVSLTRKVDDFVVHGVVQNDSPFAGEEVVQVYAKIYGSDLAPKNFRLVGFTRVAVAEKARQDFTLTFAAKQLEVVDEAGQWLNAGTRADIFVGLNQPDEKSCQLTGQTPEKFSVKL